MVAGPKLGNSAADLRQTAVGPADLAQHGAMGGPWTKRQRISYSKRAARLAMSCRASRITAAFSARSAMTSKLLKQFHSGFPIHSESTGRTRETVG